ncbi:MAG: hypothetical protein MI700_12910 [Balneolales bacterium]|nr:hypothetical protein [Balneolales bacterium]
MGFYDYDTGLPLDVTTKVVFNEESAQYIVDIFSDRIDSIETDGGFLNIGISNSSPLSQGSPIDIILEISAEGYLSQSTSISLSDTGYTSLDFDLFSLTNLPENISVSTNTAPLDENGLALPMPAPFDTTSGDPLFVTPDLALKTANDGIQLPYPMILTDIPDTYEFNGIILSIHPTSLEITARSWTTNPDFITDGFFHNGNRSSYYRVLFSAELKMAYNYPVPGSPYLAAGIIHDYLKDGYAYNLGILGFNFGNVNQLIDEANKNVGSYQKYINYESGDIIIENPIDINGKLEFWDWIGGGLIREAKEGESFYSLYSDLSNSTDFFQNFYFSNIRPFFWDNEEIQFYIFEDYSIVAELEMADIRFDIRGAEEYSATQLDVQIKSEGYTFDQTYYYNQTNESFERDSKDEIDPLEGNTIPLANSRVTIKGNGLDYSTIIDFSDLSNGATVVIQLPPPPANAIESKLIANLKCENSGKSLRVDNLPNTSFYYRKVGENSRFQSIPLGSSNWDYDEVEKVLKSASLTINNVEEGAEYEFFILIENERQPKTGFETLTIEGPEITKSIDVPNDYCQN